MMLRTIEQYSVLRAYISEKPFVLRQMKPRAAKALAVVTLNMVIESEFAVYRDA